MSRSVNSQDRSGSLLSFCGLGLVAVMLAAASEVAFADETLVGVETKDSDIVLSTATLRDRKPRDQADLTATDQGREDRLVDILQSTQRELIVVNVDLRKKAADRVRLQLYGTPEAAKDAVPAVLRVTGLKSDEAFGSLVAINSTTLLGVVSHYSDTPPYALATINLQNGKVKRINKKLNVQARYSNLTRCPNKNIYATFLSLDSLQLVRFNKAAKTFVRESEINVVGRPIIKDLASLACDSNNLLYGLGDPSYRGVNSLFELDPATGRLRELATLDAEEVTFDTTVPEEEL